MRFFERRLSREARIHADAQALLEDGLSVPDVLALYPDDALWLSELLVIDSCLQDGLQAPQLDRAFSGALREAFLAAARRPSFIPAPEPSTSWLRTSMAGAAVAAAVGALGIVTFGFITADQAVPGDWNYTFKVTQERLEDTFTNGDQQLDVQIRRTEARVYELQRLNDKGPISAGDLKGLDREAKEITEIARDRTLADAQVARLRGVLEGASIVLNQTLEQQPELAPAVASTRKTVQEAVAATGAGPVASIPEATTTPTSEATSTATSVATPTSPPTATSTPLPTETATATPTAPSPTAPSATATPVPETTATAEAPTSTVTPSTAPEATPPAGQ